MIESRWQRGGKPNRDNSDAMVLRVAWIACMSSPSDCDALSVVLLSSIYGQGVVAWTASRVRVPNSVQAGDSGSFPPPQVAEAFLPLADSWFLRADVSSLWT